MSTFLRSEVSLVDGPPKRVELDSNPVPDALGTAGAFEGSLGVGAEEEDLDGAFLTSGTGGGGLSH